MNRGKHSVRETRPATALLPQLIQRAATLASTPARLPQPDDQYVKVSHTWPRWKNSELVAVIYAVAVEHPRCRGKLAQLKHSEEITKQVVKLTSRFNCIDNIHFATSIGKIILGHQPGFDKTSEAIFGINAFELHIAQDDFDVPKFYQWLQLFAERGPKIGGLNICAKWPERYLEAKELILKAEVRK